MDLEIIILWNKPEKYTYKWYHLYVESKNKRYKITYAQNKNSPTDIENKLMITREERGGRD